MMGEVVAFFSDSVFRQVFVFCYFFCAALQADGDHVLDEVQVDASALESMGQDAYSIELDKNQLATFQDAFRGVPSLQATPPSGFGQALLISIRGAGTDQNVVNFDGMTAPSGIELGRFDFSRVSLDDFEEVSVQAGPFEEASPAMPIGGVVSLTTKRGRGKPSSQLKSEVGSLRTASLHTHVSGEHQESDFYLSASFRRSGTGRRPSLRGEGNLSDEGFFKSVTANLGHFFSDTLEGRFIFSTNHQEALVDDFDQGVPLYRGSRQRGRFDRISPQLSWSPSPQWRHDLRLSYGSSDLRYRSRTFFQRYHSHAQGVAYRVEKRVSPDLSLSAGYEGTRDVLQRDSSKASQQIKTSRFFSEAQGRLGKDWQMGAKGTLHHHVFGRESLTLSARLAYDITPNLSLFLKSGQGLKPPSLIDFYGVPPFQKANPDLRPEKSLTSEVGLHYQGKKNHFFLSFFQNRIRDIIVPERGAQGIYTSYNKGKKHLEGAEFRMSQQLYDVFVLALGYGYTRSRPQAGADPAVRLARHKITASLHYQPEKELTIFLEALYKSPRQDFNFTVFPAKRETLGAFTIVRTGFHYALSDRWQGYGRIENLFDARYEEVLGYRARGREILIGVKVEI